MKRIHPARGDKFDPHQHQAMAEVPGTDVAGGGVVDVMQSGYELLGRLVRPALVMVAAKTAGAEAPASGANGAQNPYSGGDGADPGAAVDKRA